MKYKVNANNDKVKIFNSKFVNNNKTKCKIIYNNKEYYLCDLFQINNNDKEKGILEIRLVLCNTKKEKENKKEIYINLFSMFKDCIELLSFSDFSKDKIYVTNISNIFKGCSSLISLSDISNWNTNKVKNMTCVFSGCSSLSSLPNISKWDISNVNQMRLMFCNCSSLISLPDISSWNISNVIDMAGLFKYEKKNYKIIKKNRLVIVRVSQILYVVSKS